MAVVCLVPTSASPQTFQPKAIHFNGTAGYSDQDLMSAVKLQPGATLSGADVNARTQKLMDTGIFDGISYKFDGVDLVFTAKPAAQLYSIRLENLPLTAGDELNAQIRKKAPLFRGKVPAEGTLLNDVQAALQDILTAEGISAAIQATPNGEFGQGNVTAMSFTITSPKVLIGEIQPQGGTLDPDAQKVLATLSGSAYDTRGSAAAIQTDVSEVYRSKGYLDAVVQASQLSTLSIGSDAVRIPFQVSAVPGSLYKVAAIQLDPGMIVSQAEFDKQAHTRTGDPATAEHVAQNWRYIERQYHDRGYMRAKVTAVPTLDHEHATVSYAVSAVPGNVYTMGKLTIENVSEDLRAAILKAWKMPEGSVFNEGAILGFFATHGVNPQLERVFATVKLTYVLKVNDDAKTVDTTIRLERRS